MSRPWILGIIALLLLAGSTSIGWSQEYLELPDEPTEQSGPSLADRLSSFREKFRRKPKPDDQTVSQPSRSRPTPPRYRNTAQASLQAQQRARRAASQGTAAQVNTAPPKPPLSQPPLSQPRQLESKGNGIVARPKTVDLLPDTQLFSRSRKPLPGLTAPKPKQFTKATDVPRAGSVANKPAPVNVARKSPITSRANELDAALADLVNSKSAPKVAETAPPPLKPSALKSPLPAASVATTNTFDLRTALLGDTAVQEVANQDQLADGEVAASTETQDLPVADAADNGAKVASTSPAKSTDDIDSVKSALDDAIKAAPNATADAGVEAAQQGPITVQQEAAQPTATEGIVAVPVAATPAKTEPPIVVESKPKPVITIATPSPSPTVPRTNTPAATIDPFESNGTPAYAAGQPASNPMREFQPEFEAAPAAQTFARPQTGILQTTQQPVIVSHVEGPRSILVGREATYQVTLENTSSTAAKNVAAEISVPEWAELVDAMSTSGVVERSGNGAITGALEWKLSDLPARASQALRLRLIPRSGRPLQLGVRWSQAPVQSQAVVEVQEPKLELAISGPQEVRFGKPQRYRLTLRNPGTGTTEGVSLRLVPPGGDENSATTQQIGSLKAGEVRDIDLELTAREAGELLIRADAVADGGLNAETTKTVLCRKPELKVDWRGPDKKYAGTVAAYYFRVSNPGTAATDPVDMSVKLPAGTEFISASEGFSVDATTGVINWSLAALDAGEEQFMQLRCKIARPGANDFLVSANCNDSDLQDSKAFQTEVVALADLKLEVSDPQGPLPLGESVVYEIRVRNRGTTGAEHINIVGLFSEGIDPTTVEGAQYTVRDGRVSFHPIKSLPAGREVVLRIHAEANQAGTHIFRTEVTCPKLDIKLAAEETTRFFEDEHSWENGQTPYMA
ncbi:MAG: hypothetical protein AAGD11_12700, partial [Planctomycetota bacterium]